MANRRRCNQIRSCHPRESASIRDTKPRARRRPLFCTKQSACVRIKPSSNERRGSPGTSGQVSTWSSSTRVLRVHPMVRRNCVAFRSLNQMFVAICHRPSRIRPTQQLHRKCENPCRCERGLHTLYRTECRSQRKEMRIDLGYRVVLE